MRDTYATNRARWPKYRACPAAKRARTVRAASKRERWLSMLKVHKQDETELQLEYLAGSIAGTVYVVSVFARRRR